MSVTPSKSPSGDTPNRKSATPSKNSGTPSRSSFSPITLPESPVSSMKQKGNLTGNARIIRDNCAMLCNLSKKWEECNHVGADTIMKIINLKLDSREKSEAHVAYTSSINGNTGDVLYPEGLEELMTELETKCNELVKIVYEMDKVKGHLIGVEKLEQFQNKGDLPIFISWPTSKFGQFAEHVVNIYNKEIKVKIKIKETVAHESTRANMIFYYCCWFYEAYIDKCLKEELYDMAMEVGFR